MQIILKLNKISKSFGGIKAVDNLSFDIYQNEILGLIGPNGSGKSTTVNLISGFYKPDSGDILYNDTNINDVSISDKSFLGISRTFQTPKPFLNLTVFESVYTSALIHNKSKKIAKEQTNEILELTDFTSLKDVKCSSLSIEKRKWLDMARLLPSRPKLLMLDECLAGLNPTEMDQGLELVKKINKEGITILFIEHVMSAVTKLCHRVVVLNEGSLLSEGKPEEVMNQEKVINAYLGGDIENA